MCQATFWERCLAPFGDSVPFWNFFKPISLIDSSVRVKDTFSSVRGKRGGACMDDRVLITINRREVFSLEDAQRILPVVRRITSEFSAKVELLIARLETLQLNQTETICALEKQVNDLIQQWN